MEEKTFVLTETGEEVQFGDELNLCQSQDLEDGKMKSTIFKGIVTPESLQFLLDCGFVKELEDDEDEGEEECELEEWLEELEIRVSNIEDAIKDITEKLNTKKTKK